VNTVTVLYCASCGKPAGVVSVAQGAPRATEARRFCVHVRDALGTRRPTVAVLRELARQRVLTFQRQGVIC
jgi:hypothetical protein